MGHATLPHKPHELQDRIEQHINRRTGRRLRFLEIGNQQGQTVVRGQAPSYYIRQLAERAAMELVPAERLELAIQVSGGCGPDGLGVAARTGWLPPSLTG